MEKKQNNKEEKANIKKDTLPEEKALPDTGKKTQEKLSKLEISNDSIANAVELTAERILTKLIQELGNQAPNFFKIIEKISPKPVNEDIETPNSVIDINAIYFSQLTNSYLPEKTDLGNALPEIEMRSKKDFQFEKVHAAKSVASLKRNILRAEDLEFADKNIFIQSLDKVLKKFKNFSQLK